MPYIAQKDREQYRQVIMQINKKLPENKTVHYILAPFIRDVLKNSYEISPRYWQHNEIVGMLESCKLEMCRRETITTYFASPEWLEQNDSVNYPDLDTEVLTVSSLVKCLDHINKAGNLNYFLTALLRYVFSDLPSKSQFFKEDVVSILETVKLHWYDTLVAPYEDEKIKENGDV